VITAIAGVLTTLQHATMNFTLTIASLLLAGLAAASCASSPTETEMDRGRLLVEANCASCHAVADIGVSPAPEAPPFRRLSESYRVSTLEEALTKGISTGHPAMPVFEFTTEDVKSIVAYLQSVQPRGAPAGEGSVMAPNATVEQIERGKHIVELQCVSCDAVRAEDKSHTPKAPALRTLAERYPVTGLEEAFAMRIMAGHPGMPDFRFGRDQINDILVYVGSIQTRQGA
jgi:mono/diheme cytochrome c family protein